MNTHRSAFLTCMCFIFCCTAQTTHAEHKKYLPLSYPKNNYWALSQPFLKQLVELFGTTIFVETGTCGGNTTKSALPLFQEIHSIELSPYLYQKATARFKEFTHVHLYCGDSARLLPEILPTLKGRILFWLDGHYSGGTTVKGDTNTPIIGELQAIAASGVTDAVIMIDDIRCFQGPDAAPEDSVFSGYPTCAEIEQLVLQINPAYQFKIFQDFAFAYLPSDNIETSPVIDACTFCRMAEEKGSAPELIAQAHTVIIAASGQEKETLKMMNDSLYGPEKFRIGHHYRVWYGLTLAHEGNMDQLHPLFACGITYYQ